MFELFDDGIDPLEVADGGKKFARPNIQEFLFFLRWVEEILLSCVQVKGEARWGNYEKNRRWN